MNPRNVSGVWTKTRVRSREWVRGNDLYSGGETGNTDGLITRSLSRPDGKGFFFCSDVETSDG